MRGHAGDQVVGHAALAECEYAYSQFVAGGFLKGGKDWAACMRLVERLDRSYKN